MLHNTREFVKVGAKKVGKHYFMTIAGRDYKLKKSAYARNYSPVHVSDNMTGKLENVVSISTACTCNPICIARMRDGNSICAHCFASAILEGSQGKRQAFVDAMEANYHLLTETVLPLDLLPVFPNVDICRIESFGDVANVTQAINYANTAFINPRVTFAWWSKNLQFLKDAFDAIGGKPSNVVVVQSSRMVNVVDDRDPIADHVFTVYTKEYADAHGININCGARDCAFCRRCYAVNDEVYISELLK